MKTGTEVVIALIGAAAVPFCAVSDQRIEVASSQIHFSVSSISAAQFARTANEGFNSWLEALPDEDWSEDFERAEPINWDDDE